MSTLNNLTNRLNKINFSKIKSNIDFICKYITDNLDCAIKNIDDNVIDVIIKIDFDKFSSEIEDFGKKNNLKLDIQYMPTKSMATITYLGVTKPKSTKDKIFEEDKRDIKEGGVKGEKAIANALYDYLANNTQFIETLRKQKPTKLEVEGNHIIMKLMNKQYRITVESL